MYICICTYTYIYIGVFLSTFVCYLVTADRNFRVVVLSGWSAVRLVPEWELIIRCDEETHVPVMSELAPVRVTSALLSESTTTTTTRKRRSRLIGANGAAPEHTRPRCDPVSHTHTLNPGHGKHTRQVQSGNQCMHSVFQWRD